MPPKGTSVKKELKKQEKIIEDKTFGLKNKNKSKAVQKFIASMQANMSHRNPEMKKKMMEAENRKKAKEAKEQSEKELQKLFREVNKDKKADKNGEEDPKVFDEATGEYLWQPEDFEQVSYDDRRLEEQIEEKIAEIRSVKQTPMSEADFLGWLSQRRDTSSKSASKAHTDKKSQSSGRNLWQENVSLFVDDDNAADEDEYVFEDDVDCLDDMKNLSIDSSLFDGSAFAE